MISHKRKCIFVHLPKCGGQSVENLLIRDSGLTWAAREPLLLRENKNLKVGPPRLAHLTYREYLDYFYISRELMDRYFKFSIVRDPYRRIESIYRHKGFSEAISFECFINEIVPQQVLGGGELEYFMKPQVEFLVDHDNKIAVEQIIKLEDMNNELPNIFSSIGMSIKDIPHVNRARVRPIHRAPAKRIQMAFQGYWQLSFKVNDDARWTEDMRKMVQGIYQSDFEQLKYKL